MATLNIMHSVFFNQNLNTPADPKRFINQEDSLEAMSAITRITAEHDVSRAQARYFRFLLVGQAGDLNWKKKFSKTETRTL